MHYKDYSWNGAKFLIADDDQYSHLLLEKVFKKTDALTYHAYNGIQAVDLALKNDIVVALIDIVMPGYDGYEVCRKIKSAKPNVICIAYSADALRIIPKQCEQAGFEKVLFKPMLPVHIFKEIEKLIAQRVYK